MVPIGRRFILFSLSLFFFFLREYERPPTQMRAFFPRVFAETSGFVSIQLSENCACLIFVIFEQYHCSSRQRHRWRGCVRLQLCRLDRIVSRSSALVEQLVVVMSILYDEEKKIQRLNACSSNAFALWKRVLAPGGLQFILKETRGKEEKRQTEA